MGDYMRLNRRNEETDERDEVLGAILRKAVEAAAGQCPSGFPEYSAARMPSREDATIPTPSTRHSFRRIPRLVAAAAIIAALGGSIATGFGLAGQAQLQTNSLEVARSIMPEHTHWVQGALSGEAPPVGDVGDFIEALWASGNSGDGLGQFF
jgi:hypothetical protein